MPFVSRLVRLIGLISSDTRPVGDRGLVSSRDVVGQKEANSLDDGRLPAIVRPHEHGWIIEVDRCRLERPKPAKVKPK
jgi:hypothetical protein